MDEFLTAALCLLGTILLAFAFLDPGHEIVRVWLRVKQMKFDPDWLNFILGALSISGCLSFFFYFCGLIVLMFVGESHVGLGFFVFGRQ